MKRTLCLLLLFSSPPSFAAVEPATSPGKINEVFVELKGRALTHSYEIQEAQSALSQKSAQVYTSWTRWLPRVDAEFSQSRSRDYSLVTSGALGSSGFSFTPQTLSLSRWALNLSVPLYQRSVHVQVEQSSAEKALAQNQFNLKVSELDWRMRLVLGNYLLQIYAVVTLDTSIKIAQANLKEADLRFELGQKTKVDVLRAKANLSTLESQKVTQQQLSARALGDLLEYSGLRQDDLQQMGLLELVKTEEQLNRTLDEFSKWEEVLPPLVPYLEAGFDSNWPSQPEGPSIEKQIVGASLPYQGFLAQETVDTRRAKTLMAQEWPTLRLQGNINKQANTWDSAFESGNQSYAVGVNLVVPLFSGGSLFSSFFEKRNAEELSRVRTERDVFHFKNEVEKERVELRSSLKLVEAQRLILEQNQEIERLSFKSYQLGKATLVELLGSENDVLTSKRTLAQTKIKIAVLIRQFAWNLGVSLP